MTYIATLHVDDSVLIYMTILTTTIDRTCNTELAFCQFQRGLVLGLSSVNLFTDYNTNVIGIWSRHVNVDLSFPYIVKECLGIPVCFNIFGITGLNLTLATAKYITIVNLKVIDLTY